MLHDVKMVRNAMSVQGTQTNRLTSLRISRQNIESKLELLLQDLATGLIARDEYEYAKKMYNNQYEQIQKEEFAVQEAVKLADRHFQDAERWVSEMRRYQMIPVVDRAMIDLMIQEIQVFQDKSIKIKLNYADPYKLLAAYVKEDMEETYAL